MRVLIPSLHRLTDLVTFPVMGESTVVVLLRDASILASRSKQANTQKIEK